MDDHMNYSKLPLLHEEDEDDDQEPHPAPLLLSSISRPPSFFSPDDKDIPPIEGLDGFLSAFKDESSKLWYLAGPAIFTSLCQYSLGAFTQTFAGHVTTLDLAAFSIENSVIAGVSLGILLGMGSAVETLCGQAFGAGQVDMLGVYLQRSWIILFATGLLITPLYIFARSILLKIGQPETISRAAGQLALWMIPQLFAYVVNFPTAKFLQAQSKIMAMAWISASALALHVGLSWLLMLRLGWGMAAGAALLDASWLFIVVGQLVYIFSGACGEAWQGFTVKAFRNMWGFVRLSIESAVMICLEIWYFMALVLFAGYLKDAEVSVAVLSVCTNILGWTSTISFGFNAAISVRVSNELGASRPRTARFSVIVMVIYSFLVGISISNVLIIFRDRYPSVFSDSEAVKEVVYELTPLLAFCIAINSIQPGLSGVAIGAGWQGLIAYVNILCYYVFGVPVGLILGYPLNMGVKGIWYGMVAGTVAQTLILFLIVYKTNWNKEASIAAKRIKYWKGETSGVNNNKSSNADDMEKEYDNNVRKFVVV